MSAVCSCGLWLGTGKLVYCAAKGDVDLVRWGRYLQGLRLVRECPTQPLLVFAGGLEEVLVLLLLSLPVGPRNPLCGYCNNRQTYSVY